MKKLTLLTSFSVLMATALIIRGNDGKNSINEYPTNLKQVESLTQPLGESLGNENDSQIKKSINSALPSSGDNQILSTKSKTRSRSRNKKSKGDFNSNYDPYRDIPEDINMINIPYKLEGEHIVILGDILAGKRDSLKGKPKMISYPEPSKWPEGIVPFEFESGFSDSGKSNLILEVIEYFSQATHIQFVPKENHTNFIVFKSTGKECKSYVGMIGGGQEVLLGSECQKRQILHELMHVLGFFHEQSRWDRDEFIQVHWENIARSAHIQYAKIPPKFAKYEGRTFDFQSILLYGQDYFAKTYGLITMSRLDGLKWPEKSDELSQGDVERVSDFYR